MSKITGLFFCLVFCTWAGVATAHNDDDFSPPSKEIDEDLDKALEEEYSDREAPPPKETVPDYAKEDEDGDHDHDGIRIRLGFMGAIVYSELYDIKVSYREGASGGGLIELAEFDDDYDRDDDYELSDTHGTYRAWLDLGKHVSLTGGFRRARFRDTQQIASGSGFTYGVTTFAAGDEVRSSFEAMTADFDLVLKPLNNSWVTLDLSVGGRYAYWRTEFERRSGTFAREAQRVEALMPMVGVGLALRPVEEFELFARFRIGTVEYERDHEWYWDDDDDRWREIEAIDKEATSFELDLGLKLVFGETFGFIVGYRLDHIEMERIAEDRSESAEGRIHGVYAGAILQF